MERKEKQNMAVGKTIRLNMLNFMKSIAMEPLFFQALPTTWSGFAVSVM